MRQVAIPLYEGVTALDAVGPWEVLSRLPDTEVRFVATEVGPVFTEGGGLALGAAYTLAETPTPDVMVIPGGTGSPSAMVDDELLEWVRTAHETTVWTTSVCSGSLILAAAGLLKGVPATSHWNKLGVLRIHGARVRVDERVVRSGRFMTAAGVSAGIDLALELAAELDGQEQAEVIQLSIEYDPRPPFASGSYAAASPRVRARAKQLLDDRMSWTHKRKIPLVAWRRALDLARTGR